MKAIELHANIDEKGQLKMDAPLKIINKRVKIIVLVPEDNDLDDEEWLEGISSNPAFDFLKEEAENIYTVAERLKIITEAAKQLTQKDDFEAYMNDFEESTQDRQLPFREP